MASIMIQWSFNNLPNTVQPITTAGLIPFPTLSCVRQKGGSHTSLTHHKRTPRNHINMIQFAHGQETSEWHQVKDPTWLSKMTKISKIFSLWTISMVKKQLKGQQLESMTPRYLYMFNISVSDQYNTRISTLYRTESRYKFNIFYLPSPLFHTTHLVFSLFNIKKMLENNVNNDSFINQEML